MKKSRMSVLQSKINPLLINLLIRHLVLKGVHPSPLAGSGFLSCTHFSQANEYLEKNGKTAINWNV